MKSKMRGFAAKVVAGGDPLSVLKGKPSGEINAMQTMPGESVGIPQELKASPKAQEMLAKMKAKRELEAAKRVELAKIPKKTPQMSLPSEIDLSSLETKKAPAETATPSAAQTPPQTTIKAAAKRVAASRQGTAPLPTARPLETTAVPPPMASERLFPQTMIPAGPSGQYRLIGQGKPTYVTFGTRTVPLGSQTPDYLKFVAGQSPQNYSEYAAAEAPQQFPRWTPRPPIPLPTEFPRQGPPIPMGPGPAAETAAARAARLDALARRFPTGLTTGAAPAAVTAPESQGFLQAAMRLLGGVGRSPAGQIAGRAVPYLAAVPLAIDAVKGYREGGLPGAGQAIGQSLQQSFPPTAIGIPMASAAGKGYAEGGLPGALKGAGEALFETASQQSPLGPVGTWLGKQGAPHAQYTPYQQEKLSQYQALLPEAVRTFKSRGSQGMTEQDLPGLVNVIAALAKQRGLLNTTLPTYQDDWNVLTNVLHDFVSQTAPKWGLTLHPEVIQQKIAEGLYPTRQAKSTRESVMFGPEGQQFAELTAGGRPEGARESFLRAAERKSQPYAGRERL